MSSTIATGEDLRKEILVCLRHWLFDFFFSGTYPYAPASTYGFTPLVFHALSHWKLWVAAKAEFHGVQFESRYKRRPYDDELKRPISLPVAPDGGEWRNHDYLLRRLGTEERKVLCAVESEYGERIAHLTEDLEKRLHSVQSPLKVMVYRMPFPDKLEPATGHLIRKQAIEATFASKCCYFDAASQLREDWLFIGFPWYRNWPRQKEDAFVKLYVLSTRAKSRCHFVNRNATSGSQMLRWINGSDRCTVNPKAPSHLRRHLRLARRRRRRLLLAPPAGRIALRPPLRGVAFRER